ncbi:MAG: hypothetical protein JSS00_01580 [Proteobacteria bacterium]|nr:hypothetical protein [Pseudomonadota bacterium]
MTEANVVEELVEFTNILLAGVGLIFSIVSAYVVALNYFIGQSNFSARLASFAFMSLVLGMLIMVLLGAQDAHMGLIARLQDLEAQHQLTAAGRTFLSNSTPEWAGIITHRRYSIDDVIRTCVWTGLGFVYFGLLYLTFLHRWTTDVINVAIEGQERRK